MKAVLYARVSSKEQEKDGFSIPAQLKLLRQYAKDKSITVVQEFVDVETARKAGRTGFNEMLELVKKDQSIESVLVEKTDRLYRNIKDWVVLDERKLKLHFVKENVVISEESRSSEKLMHGIKVLMAKNYTDNLSEEVRKGFLEKCAQGQWPTKAPVGYRNVVGTGLIEADPEKGPLVARVFEAYASGDHSLKSLSKLMKESGLFSQNSITINKAGIHRILKNPIYYGEFDWKGKRYQGIHTPLISFQLYNKVQNVLGRKSKPISSKREFAFTGLVKCGQCGCAMTPEIKKGKYVYYHCTKFHGNCDNIWVREEELGLMLAGTVQAMSIDVGKVEDIKQALRESQADMISFRSESLTGLQKRESHLMRLVDKSYEDKLEGLISEDMWRRKSHAWQVDLEAVRNQIRLFNDANLDYYEFGSSILELANSAYDKYLKQGVKEQRRLLNSVLSNCTFYRGSVCPTYKSPFDILAKQGENIKWRGRRDSNSRPPA